MNSMEKDFPNCDFSFIPKGVTVNYRRYTSVKEFAKDVFARVNNKGLEEAMFIPFGMERVSLKSETDKVVGRNVLVFFTKTSNPKVYDFMGVI